MGNRSESALSRGISTTQPANCGSTCFSLLREAKNLDSYVQFLNFLTLANISKNFKTVPAKLEISVGQEEHVIH